MNKESPVKRPRNRPLEPLPDLTDDERKEYLAILANPVFRKALARVQNMKPSAFTHLAPGLEAGNNRLHEIRGWELFEHALFLQAQVPKPRIARATETYPNQGVIDYEQ